MHPKNDGFLVWARAHFGWLVGLMNGLDAGELALFVRLFITDRFVHGGKPTYAYEVAWVFQRDRGTIGHVLRKLEENEEIARKVSSSKGSRTLYIPVPEDVKDELSETRPEQSDGDDGWDWLRKDHRENCPCLELVGRW